MRTISILGQCLTGRTTAAVMSIRASAVLIQLATELAACAIVLIRASVVFIVIATELAAGAIMARYTHYAMHIPAANGAYDGVV